MVLALLVCVVSSCDLAQSHVDANVPPKQDFDSFLKRDLTKYFSDGKEATVVIQYELLRDGPTQTGISYPKFYAWVRVVRNGTHKEDGAVRLAAIDGLRFEVTDYLNRATLISTPSQMESVFPKSVCDRIREKLN